MQLTLSICAALAALALAACGNPANDAEATAGDAAIADAGEEASQNGADEAMDEDLCGAGDYQSLVGSSIAAVTLPSDLNHRVIGPNDAVTMDYNPERLNIYTDEDGVITEVKCG